MRAKIPELWRAALPPVLLSLALSALTVGTRAQWQDSSIYLTAVREFGVLYPPGFTLYLVLCKAWTLVTEPVFGFTLAVHLFSSVCAAAAAGAVAAAGLAAGRNVAAAAAVGCLAASGYTWWFSGIYAKGYALFALVVALFLLRLLKKDVRGAAVLLALAWAAHPSAALLLPAALLYAWVHRGEILALGRRRLALTAALALLCGVGPTLLLPVLSARETPSAMGHVTTIGRLAEYFVGKKFFEFPDVWGWSTARVLTLIRYVWEEFLGVGLALVALGLAATRKEAPLRLVGLAVWTGTVVAVTALFKIEGQHDLWLLSVYMPLYAAAAVGLAGLARRWAPAPFLVGAAGVIWAFCANYRDVDQRGYDLAERFGEAYLQPVAKDSILVLRTDDALGMCRYLQVVRGQRPDVLIVAAPFLWSPEGKGWYFERLSRARPGLRPPDERPPDPAADFSRVSHDVLSPAALANANSTAERPVYFEVPPPARALRKDLSLVRAGLLWKAAPAGAPESVQEDVDAPAEEIAGRIRRERGQWLRLEEGRLSVGPEPYEWRFVRVLLEFRAWRAERFVALRTPEGFRRAAALFESILRLDRDEVFDGRRAFAYGNALAGLGDRRAAIAFESALEKGGLTPSQQAIAWLHRGDAHRAEKQEAQARACFERAAAIPGVEPAVQGEIERRLK